MSASYPPGEMATFRLSYFPVKIQFTGGLDWGPRRLPATISSSAVGLGGAPQPLRCGSLLPESHQQTEERVIVSFCKCALGVQQATRTVHCPLFIFYPEATKS